MIHILFAVKLRFIFVNKKKCTLLALLEAHVAPLSSDPLMSVQKARQYLANHEMMEI